ncbi:hypothetical protein MSG28_012522 [Choristoneura fumiferana]|uniref:Uncharacterized protein n=1 Tax=Choristoneura fumiferana TaxID=7141 RepID=A0ACC0KE56_CHOFU|nr:hypothetical protein MSG28_012522 [Choristoneura fumiferana]
MSPTETGHACRDVDECRDNPRVCRRGRCRNTPGGYECQCELGFALTAAGYCADCVCEAGYRTTPDRGACVDVDECSEQRVCRNGRCHNTPGSFRCECAPGFTLSNDGRTCLGLHLGWGGLSCKACPEIGSRDYETLCPEGPSKDNDGTDINECTMIPGICAHGACENLDPGYRCICDLGFHSDGDGICKDIDECDMHQSYCQGGQCRNTQGSFTCVCPQGTRYEPDEQLCRDIDECEGELLFIASDYDRGDIPPMFPVTEQVNPCDNGRCINTHGGYECKCENGFVLDASARHCLVRGGGAARAAAPGVLLQRGAGLGVALRALRHHRLPLPQGLRQGNRCVDTRHEPCYTEWSGGRCGGTLPGAVLRSTCCCSALGRAWGGARCEPCPKKGTDGYRNLCGIIFDVNFHPEIWDRLGGGNRTGIYGSTGNNNGNGDDWFNSNNNGNINGNNNNHDWTNNIDNMHINGSFDHPWGSDNKFNPTQMEVNECSAFPGLCGQGRCRNIPGSFECDCFPGYEKDGKNRTCVDINECRIVDDVCGAGECFNTEGSFHCRCRPGHKPDELSKVCVDIDECVEETGLCRGGRCVNTPGSFRCECGVGMELAPDRLSCKDVDECSITSGICSNGACENLMGTYQCVCDEGYAQSTVKSHCEDIDECAEDETRCQHECVNTPGSYHCKCRDGWHLRADGRTCRDIDECAGGARPCGGGECRNTPGGYRCECGEGLLPSPEGSKPTNSCTDIDECANDPTLCENGHCGNTPGGYECDCDVGFTRSPDARSCLVMPGFNCTDVDECKSPQSCQYGTCINTEGSYICRCPPNYELVSDGTACFDSRKARCYGKVDLRSGTEHCIDSDELSEDGTMAACCCSVEPGSEAYRQLCPGGSGYQPVLEPPSYVVTLADIDECSQHPALCEHGTCTNTFGSFVCTCGEGWQLAPGDIKCEDVDECAVPDVCGPGVCRNMPGSYVCLCPEGYVAMPNGKECVDVRQRQCYMDWDEDTQQCASAVGVPQTKYLCCCSTSSEHTALCGDKPGEYINPVTNETKPIDECSIMPQLCKPGRCHDTAGGFTCGCDHGYIVILPGVHECRPLPGYRLTPSIDSCEDVEECANSRLCEHGECRNTIGSFRCECKPGYTLRDNACRDVDECARPRPLCRNGTCENLPGSYMCHCDEGFKPGANNDCIGGMVCRNGRCRNTVGSFRCECAPGYALSGDARNCRDVDDYECSCAKGWRLANKRCVDRDECREIPDVYRCICPPGWSFYEELAICVDERKELCYDEWSSGRCHRVRSLHLSRPECCCSDVSASVKSDQDSETGDGMDDLNECEVRPDICKGGRCVNTDGSFRCECPDGYQLDATGLACADTDECLVDPRICGNGTCTNKPGEYECRCNQGFTQGPEQTCVDIDECAEGLASCSFRCHNTPGSFRCTCPYGYVVAADGVHCRDIDECAAEPAPCPHACENTVGSYKCKCPEDRRTGTCHRSLVSGRCVPEPWPRAAVSTPAVPMQVTKAICCCTLGVAWGPECELCPQPGTPERLDLCTPENLSPPGSHGGSDGHGDSQGSHGGHGGHGGHNGGGSGSELVPDTYVDVDECAAMPGLCTPGRCVNTIGR